MKLIVKGVYAGLAGIVLFLSASIAPAQTATAQRAESASVWIIPVHGNIEPSLTAFVRREARKALNQNADYIIFEIDTFGGRVDAALQIASFIMSIREAKTIAWVRSGETSLGVSWSAGALIALSCTEIYMAPGTSIGAAAPVMMGADGSSQLSDEKTVAAVRSQMAALANRNGHPEDIALAMVDFDIELWEVTINGEVRALSRTELERREVAGESGIVRVTEISPRGKLLSLHAADAYRYGLINGLASDQYELFSILEITADVTESYPSVADDIISFLTSGTVQAILILLGLVMIFLEIQSPGFGIPGVIGIIAFLIVFGSSALLGRVGSLEIILFLIGVGFLAVEIFILPGFGVMGVSGIIIIGLSLTLSMQDFVIPRFDWEWELLGRNAMVVFAGLVASIFGIAIIALLGPRIKIFDPIMLKTAIVGTAGGPDPDSPVAKTIPSDRRFFEHEDEEDFGALVGKIGTTDSILRPSGRALIDGKIYDVEADREFVDAGRGVVVVRVRGNRITVRRV